MRRKLTELSCSGRAHLTDMVGLGMVDQMCLSASKMGHTWSTIALR